MLSFSDFSTAKVIVNVGSGGVGKTTISAALGLWAAKEGKRVLVITVDPAKRLATTLGITPDGQVHGVVLPEAKGRLFAAVLDSKSIFDAFIKKASAGSGAAERLYQNKLYQQLSTTLSGSQEFSALELLYSQYESGDYDLIILDTPPTKHAIDFLESPSKIATLFSEQITKWFRMEGGKGNFFVSIFSSGTMKVLNALKLLTGAEFISQLQDFFITIQSWQEKLHGRTMAVETLLKSKDTTFNLVTSMDLAKIKEARYFSRKLEAANLNLHSIVINRAYPTWLVASTGTGSALDNYLAQLNTYFQQRYDNFRKVMSGVEQTEVYILPEYNADVCDLEGLGQLLVDLKKVERT